MAFSFLSSILCLTLVFKKILLHCFHTSGDLAFIHIQNLLLLHEAGDLGKYLYAKTPGNIFRLSRGLGHGCEDQKMVKPSEGPGALFPLTDLLRGLRFSHVPFASPLTWRAEGHQITLSGDNQLICSPFLYSDLDCIYGLRDRQNGPEIAIWDQLPERIGKNDGGT
ncbi:hypothetical protein E2C01_057244 [Portunus trituberculatus]|uniref:Uncharacterized protein n=1 Tax=Portunus trituberculatus TaxID=210409 RepID=A0A5B7GSW7_PORTR|nr:hypothetical protein [Portunus trituberculatus]